MNRAIASSILAAALTVTITAPRPHAGESIAPARVVFVERPQAPGRGCALRVLDTASGTFVTLVDAPEGDIRDPSPSFDGTRIVFALRGLTGGYGIHVTDAATGGVRRLTPMADADDTGPAFLPDGGVVFSSTRGGSPHDADEPPARRLYRIDGDGSVLTPLGSPAADESDPAVLDDGRIIYVRRETAPFIDGRLARLWTMCPDGTEQALYWGETLPTLGAPFMPGQARSSGMVWCLLGPTARRGFAPALIDRSRGVQDTASVLAIRPSTDMEMTSPRLADADPGMLMVGSPGGDSAIVLIGPDGGRRVLYTTSGSCEFPVALDARPRPHVIPSRRVPDMTDGRFYILDATIGAPMRGIDHGTVAALRVIAVDAGGIRPPADDAPDHATTGPAFCILGVVPVAMDGSAYFAAPADTALFFQLLDGDGRLIQSMRGTVTIRPGERHGCIGCHEDRLTAPPQTTVKAALAFERDPSPLTGWRGPPRIFAFDREVRPVLDSACIRCHGVDAGDDDRPVFTGFAQGGMGTACMDLAAANRAALPATDTAEPSPPRSWGSSASPLLRMLQNGHHGVVLDADRLDRLAAWIDLGMPCTPTYGESADVR